MTSAPDNNPEQAPRMAATVAWAVATVVVGAVVVVGFWGAQFCHDRENSSNLFVHRCDDTITPYLPLIGLVILAIGYVVARALRKPWLRALSLLLALASEVVTAYLLSV
jgi:hypothetical protein